MDRAKINSHTILQNYKENIFLEQSQFCYFDTISLNIEKLMYTNPKNSLYRILTFDL